MLSYSDDDDDIVFINAINRQTAVDTMQNIMTC